MSKPCVHCGAFGGTEARHLPNCVVQAARNSAAIDARKVREVPKFSSVGKVIMRGSEFIARARSSTMAERIANALNVYIPSKRGS